MLSSLPIQVKRAACLLQFRLGSILAIAIVADAVDDSAESAIITLLVAASCFCLPVLLLLLLLLICRKEYSHNPVDTLSWRMTVLLLLSV